MMISAFDSLGLVGKSRPIECPPFFRLRAVAAGEADMLDLAGVESGLSFPKDKVIFTLGPSSGV